MSENFISNMSELTGKTIEELTSEFSDFSEIVNNQFGGRLEGEELVTKSESLFRQKCRSQIKSDESDGSVLTKMYVFGISDTLDKLTWQRGKAIDIYNINPNKAIMEGRVNEYRVTDSGVMKRSFDQASQEVVEKMIKDISPNAEEVEELILVAPVDSQKTGFGGKKNDKFGQELPLHKYSCYVHGFSEIEGSDDFRWTKFMLRGNNSVDHGLCVNDTYEFKVINMSDKDSDEYNFIDTDELHAVSIDWNPFDGEFVEEVIETNLTPEVRKIELGDVEDYLKNVEYKKESRKFKDWNGAILVEVDISKIFIADKEGYSDRMYVDDDSLRWGDDDNVFGNINVWVSRANEIDFGEYSRVLLTCYPSRGRPPKDSPDGTKGRMQLNAYGIYAFLKYKTRFELEE